MHDLQVQFALFVWLVRLDPIVDIINDSFDDPLQDCWLLTGLIERDDSSDKTKAPHVQIHKLLTIHHVLGLNELENAHLRHHIQTQLLESYGATLQLDYSEVEVLQSLIERILTLLSRVLSEVALHELLLLVLEEQS